MCARDAYFYVGRNLPQQRGHSINLMLANTVPIESVTREVLWQEKIMIDKVKLSRTHSREAQRDLAAHRTESNDAKAFTPQSMASWRPECCRNGLRSNCRATNGT